ncbi:MAG: hypothetical protein IJ616_04090 [Bacteroidales bacterium]|nr:hypothetical protein [Bacteroidales bacterium]
MSHCPHILTLTHKYTLRNSHIIRHTLRRYLGAAITGLGGILSGEEDWDGVNCVYLNFEKVR